MTTQNHFKDRARRHAQEHGLTYTQARDALLSQLTLETLPKWAAELAGVVASDTAEALALVSPDRAKAGFELLDERERKIIELGYLTGEADDAAIALELGLQPERVKQLRKRAFRKMRNVTGPLEAPLQQIARLAPRLPAQGPLAHEEIDHRGVGERACSDVRDTTPVGVGLDADQLAWLKASCAFLAGWLRAHPDVMYIPQLPGHETPTTVEQRLLKAIFNGDPRPTSDEVDVRDLTRDSPDPTILGSSRLAEAIDELAGMLPGPETASVNQLAGI
jgi:hypothetical protein